METLVQYLDKESNNSKKIRAELRKELMTKLGVSRQTLDQRILQGYYLNVVGKEFTCFKKMINRATEGNNDLL